MPTANRLEKCWSRSAGGIHRACGLSIPRGPISPHPIHLIWSNLQQDTACTHESSFIQYSTVYFVQSYSTYQYIMTQMSQMCNKMTQNVRSYVVWSPGPVQFRASWSWWATTGASAPRTSLATRRSSIRLWFTYYLILLYIIYIYLHIDHTYHT